jgi:predicted enzyme related to lactoylglutathione lyase
VVPYTDCSIALHSRMASWSEWRAMYGKPYLIAHSGSQPIAGIAQVARRRPDDPIAQWVRYLSVDNVDSAVARVAAAGGRVLVAPADTRAGRITIVVDPQGAQFGLVRRGSELVPPRRIDSSKQARWTAERPRPTRVAPAIEPGLSRSLQTSRAEARRDGALRHHEAASGRLPMGYTRTHLTLPESAP